MPTESSEVVVLTQDETSALINSGAVSEQNQVELAYIRSRVEDKAVLAVIHCEESQHYTVLEKKVAPDGVVTHSYYDSLQAYSQKSRQEAQKLCNQLGWNVTVPLPANSRFQIGNWECGLFSLQFVEESLRRIRGELVYKYPVKLALMISRLNDFVAKVSPSLPAVSSPPKETVSAPAVDKPAVVKKAKAAVAAAAKPVPPVPVLSGPVVGVGFSTIPKSATTQVDQGSLTLEQAQSAKSTCSKCRHEGCSWCMDKWFVPKKVWSGTVPQTPRARVQESQETRARASLPRASSTVQILEGELWT